MPTPDEQSTTVPTPRLTRRSALGRLGATGAAAATLALPTAAPALARSPRPLDRDAVHGVYCFHEKYRVPETRDVYPRLQDTLCEMVSRDVWKIYVRLSDMALDRHVAETDRFVDLLCTHFPGLAPGIRAVAYHAMEVNLGEEAGCCTESWAHALEEDDDATTG